MGAVHPGDDQDGTCFGRDAAGLRFDGVDLVGATALGPSTVEGLSLSVDADGITLLGPLPGAVRLIPWSGVSAAALGPPVTSGGGRVATPLDISSSGRTVRFHLFADRVQAGSGEVVADVLASAADIGGTRAALFGRAPVGKDVEHALALFGYLGDAPDDLVAWRTPLFRSAAHEYQVRQALVDLVPDETLRLTADQVRQRLGQWRALLATLAEPALPGVGAP
jgi:hypothetical protein